MILLPGALDDAVPERDGRDAVPAPQVEPGSAGDQDIHVRRRSRRSAFSRYTAMIQNTVVEIAPALIRDRRMY
jgi:hypothetical protein